MILELQFASFIRTFFGCCHVTFLLKEILSFFNHCHVTYPQMEPLCFLIGLYKEVSVSCFSDPVVQKTVQQSDAS